MDESKIPEDIVEMSVNNSDILTAMSDYYRPFYPEEADIFQILSAVLLAPVSKNQKIKDGAKELVKDFGRMIEVSNFKEEIVKETGGKNE